MAENLENSNPKKRKVELSESDEKLVNESIALNQKLSEFAKYVQTLDSTDIIDHFLEILETQKREIIEGSQDLEILHEVNEQGFAVRVETKSFRTRDIKELHRFRLPYHVRIYSISRLKEDPAKTAKVDRSVENEDQPEWVEATGFELNENENLEEDMDFDNITKDWGYGDHDDPIYGLGRIDCSFYFAPKFPDKTKAFDLLDEDGEIGSFAVGEFNETEDEWEKNIRYVMYKETK